MRVASVRPRVAAGAVVLGLLVMGPALRSGALQNGLALDADARRWVDQTLATMTLDEKIGQLIVPSFFSAYTSSDSEIYQDLSDLVHGYHVGGMLVFGARQPRSDLLRPARPGRNILGEPLSAASMINRLQAISRIPLLVTADFETGVGFRMSGATNFPRAMAFGATRDPRLAFEAGRITAREGRAIGVHLNLAPVVDVNNNPSNPVINTRSFGEDPALVGELAGAYVEGLRSGGMLATLKHFPGHGDTDVDSHLGLPLIAHPRDRLETIELAPFRRGVANGVDAVMTAHIQLPSLEPTVATPTTFSRAIVEGLLRNDLGFAGLVLTDSMRMRAVTDLVEPGVAASRAVSAGHDLVVHSPDDRAAYRGVRDAVTRGQLSETRLDRSVERVLTAKARVGLHRASAVSLDTLPSVVGARAHREVARDISERSMTLLRDEGHHVPLSLERSADVLYLSVLDDPSGWGITAPSQALVPRLEEQWPNLTAIELTDQTPVSEIRLVREAARRYDAVIVGLFVRAASLGGRMDLAGPVAQMIRGLARAAGRSGQPFITVFFGNPYVATYFAEAPTMLVTYDVRDLAQESAVRVITGSRPVQGRLPVTLSDEFPAGHGLVREARSP